MPERKDKGHRRDASQYFVAGELCRREIVAVITLGNCPNTDILCSNAAGTRFAHVQVKTFRPGTKTCSVGLKAERDYGPGFFWVLGGIPEPQSNKDFEYYIIPSAVMAKNITDSFKKWAASPSKDPGKPHDANNSIRVVALPPGRSINGWDVSQYRNRWDLIQDYLKSK